MGSSAYDLLAHCGATCKSCPDVHDLVAPQRMIQSLTLGRVSASLCSNDCDSTFDGSCDDGGPNAAFNTCRFGADCEDCKARDVEYILDRTGTGTCPDGLSGISSIGE